MATWDELRRIALALPETTEQTGDTMSWRVRDKLFAWERPLRAADRTALGDEAPTGPVLAVRVAGMEEKDALLRSNPRVFFTTPHFNGYAAVLVRLDDAHADELEEVVGDAWVARAPKRVAAAYLAGRDTSS